MDGGGQLAMHIHTFVGDESNTCCIREHTCCILDHICKTCCIRDPECGIVDALSREICGLEAQPSYKPVSWMFPTSMRPPPKPCALMKRPGIHHEVYIGLHTTMCAVEWCKKSNQETIWHFHELGLLDSNAKCCPHGQWLTA